MDGFFHLDPIFPTRMLRRRSLLDSFGSVSSQPSARRSLAPHATYLSERNDFTNDSRRDIPINLDLELEQTSSRRIPRIVPRSRQSSNSTYFSESDDITNDSRRDFPINVDIGLEETSSRRIPLIVPKSRQSSNSTYLSESDDIANDNRRDIPIDLDIERVQTSPPQIPLIVPRSRRTTFNYGLVSRDAPVSVEHSSGNEVNDLIENPRNLRVVIEPRGVRETPTVSERASITGRREFRRRTGGDDDEEKDYNRGGRDDTIGTNDEEEITDAKEDLKITDIDYHVTDNEVAHKTDKFPHVAKGQLVVRRGQKFEVTVELNGSFDIYKDKLLLTLQTGLSLHYW
ncbi:hypothetical protein DPMN_174621 [Dreissena polymorpha]|uniref:Transglutaminase N-terminal domain-containing protein n=1 Tax=Dreissena polymorpha TaxID=45954 RepID=A0A9D4E5P6_DREPO|nr:hypothetical protein DPMN_174621 [Dreissena polymorpha]